MRFLRLHQLRIVAGTSILLLIVLKARAVLSRAEPFDFVDDRPRLVQRIIDGDTLLLSDGRRIRLLGVNTPETKHPNQAAQPWGREATEFTERFLKGRAVTLRFDRERLDRYDRLLAYAYADEELLNEELIRAGLSRAETRFPYSESMKRRFRAAEEQAREAKVGIWGEPKAFLAGASGDREPDDDSRIRSE